MAEALMHHDNNNNNHKVEYPIRGNGGDKEKKIECYFQDKMNLLTHVTITLILLSLSFVIYQMITI